MKSPEYVAIVVSTYRRALDEAAAGTFVPDEAALRDLALAFNRGFTRGYLFGDRKGSLMGRDRPDNRGLLIGTVSGYDRRKGTATLCPDLAVTLHPGDGLLFSHPGNPEAEWGFSLNTEPGVKTGGDRTRRPPPGGERCPGLPDIIGRSCGPRPADPPAGKSRTASAGAGRYRGEGHSGRTSYARGDPVPAR